MNEGTLPLRFLPLGEEIRSISGRCIDRSQKAVRKRCSMIWEGWNLSIGIQEKSPKRC